MAEPGFDFPPTADEQAAAWASPPTAEEQAAATPDLPALADEAADRHGIPRHLFRGMIRQESNWNPRAQPLDAGGNLRSSAKGLGQLIDSTAAGVGVQDPFDPAQNLEGSAKYLRQMADRFGGDWNQAVLAYHDGPGAIAERGPSADAQEHLARVLGHADAALQADLDSQTQEQEAPPSTAADTSLAAFRASTSTLSPDDGAEALDHAQATGLGPTFVAGALPAVQQAAAQQQARTALASAPVTAAFINRSPAHAAAAKDDIGPLTTMEWIFGRDKLNTNPTPADLAYAKANNLDVRYVHQENEIPSAIASYYAKGIFGLRAALLGVLSATTGLTKDDKQHLTEAQEYAAAEVPDTKGHLGREMFGATAESLPQLAPFIGGAWAAAPFLFAQTFGSMKNQFHAQTKEDGTRKYTDEQENKLALGGAVATTAIMGGLGAKFARGTAGFAVGKLLPKAAQESVATAAAQAFMEKALEVPVLRAALRPLQSPLVNKGLERLLQLQDSLIHGAAFMMGLAAINDLTDQAGDVMTGGKYDPSKTVEAAKKAAEGSLMLLPLMLASPTIGLVRDVGRVRRAHESALEIATQIEAAKESKLIKRAPSAARELLDAQATAERYGPKTEGADKSTLYMPTAAFDAAMREAGLDPAEAAKALHGDDGSGYQQAQATGQLAVPTAEMLVQLAPEKLADKLLADMKTDPSAEAMTLREADAATPLLDGTLRDMHEVLTVEEARALYQTLKADELIGLTQPIAADLTPAQKKILEGEQNGKATTPNRMTPEAKRPPVEQSIYDREHAAMLEAGQSEDAADAFASLRAQIATALAKRFGGTAEAWHAAQGELRLHQGGLADAGALAQPGAVAAPWYSAVERAVEGAKQAKNTPEAWTALLSKTPGVKAEEIAETGVGKWLAEQKGSVTREQVADYLKQHRVELHEKVLGGETSRAAYEAQFNYQREEQTFIRLARMADFTEHGARNTAVDIAQGHRPAGELSGKLAEAGQALREAYLARAAAPPLGSEPHYQEYTAGVHKPGTYREILLTSPAARDYNAPHFGEDSQGIIAHARVGETTDAQGRKVLMVEEIQSDLHQEGRSKGYESTEEQAALVEKMTAARHRVQDWLDEGDHAYDIRRAAGSSLYSPVSIHGQWGRTHPTREAALAEARSSDVYRHSHGTVSMERLSRLGAPESVISAAGEAMQAAALIESPKRKLPDVPWKDTWEELMVRRLVRYAAEHGFERIALTPGKVHADRYGTEAIAWEGVPAGKPDTTPLAPSEMKVGHQAHQWVARAPDGRSITYSMETTRSSTFDEIATRAAHDLNAQASGGWRVSVSSQRGGLAAGVNIEVEAERRGLLKKDSRVTTSKEDLTAALRDTLESDKHADKVWDRMQKEDTGLSRPRAEGFDQAYDKRIKGAFDKQLKKYGGKMEGGEVGANRSSTSWGGSGSVADGGPLHAFVADLPAALREKVLAEGQPLFQRELLGTGGGSLSLTAGAGHDRGFITFDVPNTPWEPPRADLHFLAAADVSTGLHELGHFLLEGIGRISQRPDAPEALKADYNLALRDIGYGSHAERTAEAQERTILAATENRSPEQQARLTELTAKEEKFSHLFETYLASGKAPTAAVKSLFARLKELMLQVYGSIKAIAAQYKAAFGTDLVLSDAMRGFFDRLVAEDKKPQPEALALAGATAKEARDFHTAVSAYAAQAIAKLKIGEIKPHVYEAQAQVHAVKMMDLAQRLEKARQGVAKTTVITPQNHAGEPATYKLVEAVDLIASHSSDGFAPEERYPKGVQERDYFGTEGEQMKVAMGAKNLNPALVLADTPTAVDGPPLVTSGAKSIVLGGNGRSMMIRRAYADGPAGAAYKEALRAKASAFGVAPEAVDAMREPVLVRSIDAIPDTASKTEMIGAVRRFNEGLTQQLSPRLRAVAEAEARTLTPRTVADIGEILGKGDESLRDLLRSSPEKFKAILERDGVINAENRAQFLTGGELTDEAKDRIEGMFLGRVMGSGERLQATPPSMVKKVERVAPSLLRVAGAHPEMDLTGDVQGAIDLLNKSASNGLSLDDMLNQRSLFVEGRVEPRTVAMARLLSEKGQKELQGRFKTWADDVAIDPKGEAQGGMFSKPKLPATETEGLATLFAGQKDDLSGPSRVPDSAAPKAEAKPAEQSPVEKAVSRVQEQRVEPQALVRAVSSVLREVQGKHLVSDALARAAEQAKEAGAKIDDSLRASAKDATRADFARAGRPFLDAYDAILGGVGKRSPVPGARIDDAVAAIRVNLGDVGFEPAAVSALLDARKTIKELRLDEAEVVRDALASIRKGARDAVEVVIAGQRQAMSEINQKVRAKLASRTDGGGGGEFSDASGVENKPRPSGFVAKGKTILTEMLQPQEILRRIGLEDLYHRDFVEARNQREALAAKIGDYFFEHYEKEMPADLKNRRLEPVEGVGGKFPGKMVRQDLWELGSWTGSESSLERAAKGLGVSEEQIFRTLDQLEKAEWDFIQSRWDFSDKVVWPLLSAHLAEKVGLAPPKIDARPVTTRFGQYRGGYNPARYRFDLGRESGQQVAEGVADAWGDLRKGFPAASSYFAKPRVQRFFDVPDLQWNAFSGHLQAVAHYLAMDGFVTNFGRILRNAEFRDTVRNAKGLGEAALAQLDEFHGVTARGAVEGAKGGALETARLFGGGMVRSRVGTAAFQLNLKVVLGQLSHLFASMPALKIHPGHMLQGVFAALRPETYDKAFANSKQLPYRWNDYGAKTREMLHGIGPESRSESQRWIDTAGWSLYHVMDGFLSRVIHEAAFLKEKANKASDADAYFAADKAVSRMMPPRNIMEQSSFARDQGVIGSMMLVRNFPNTIYNVSAAQMWDAQTGVHDAAPGWSKAKAYAKGTAVTAASLLGTYLSVHVIGRYLMGHGKEEDETHRQWLLRESLAAPLYQFGPLEDAADPFIRSLVSGRTLKYEILHGHAGLQNAPSLAFFNDSIRSLADALDRGQPQEKRAFASLRLFSRLAGGPSSLLPSIQYGYRLGIGREHPRSIFDLGSGLLYGKHDRQSRNLLTDFSHLTR